MLRSLGQSVLDLFGLSIGRNWLVVLLQSVDGRPLVTNPAVAEAVGQLIEHHEDRAGLSFFDRCDRMRS
jgi:hypothetical protein